MLQRGGKPTMLGRAIREVAEFIKHCISLYILMMKPTEEEF